MPTFWQWFFAIIAGVAFIMAAPIFLQLIFGQPKLEFNFGYDDSGDEGRITQIYLRNIPIECRALQILRVSRLTAQDVFLYIQVSNYLTGEVLLNLFMPDIESSSSNKANRVSLPPSSLSAKVSLAKWQRSTNSAMLIGNHDMPLEEGKYLVVVGRGLDGKMRASIPLLLHVGKTEGEMMWDKDIMDKRCLM